MQISHRRAKTGAWTASALTGSEAGCCCCWASQGPWALIPRPSLSHLVQHTGHHRHATAFLLAPAAHREACCCKWASPCALAATLHLIVQELPHRNEPLRMDMPHQNRSSLRRWRAIANS